MKPQPRGLKTKRLDDIFPDWCQWLPSASLKFVGDCAGYGGPDQIPTGPQCASWCQWVPQASWFDPPDCRGCQPAGASDNVSEEDVPLWCSWVPPLLLQFVDACATGGSIIPAVAEGCTYWCVWVSGPAWHHVHECHGCSNETTQNSTNSTNGTQEEREDAVVPRHGTAGLKVKLVDPLADPDWCRWVPAGSLEHVPDCAGYGGDSGDPWPKPSGPSAARRQCESWCQWVPQPAWQYPPGCRGCA